MIRPVDYTLSVQRAAEVTRPESGAARPEVTQNFAAQFQKLVEHENQAVIDRNKPEETDVDKDGKGQGGNGGSSRRKKKNRQEAESGQKRKSDSMLDISI